MPTDQPRSHRGRNTAIALGAVLILGSATKEVIDLAAPPAKEKTCDLSYPTHVDPSQATRITVTWDGTAPLQQTGGFMNDASCLNKTAVFGVADIRSEEDVRNALQFARENGLKVTPAGQQHSMGGQSFVRGGLVLDMRNFRGIKLDAEARTVTVDTGATWADIQAVLDPAGLSVAAMQSINIFTVGGTLSVNAHGIAHVPGNVAPTVRSLRILLPNGEEQTASFTENAELFRHALGGYGLFGIILSAELDVVPNEAYVWSTNYIEYKNVPEFYKESIEGNDAVGLFYGRISVAPSSYLSEVAVHTYRRAESADPIPPLQPEGLTWINRLVINLSKTGGFGRALRWTLEKALEPKLHPCISRNQAMSANEVCVVSRNQEMYDSMGYLKNRLKDTDILQEYFVPRERLPEFVDGLRAVVASTDANLLNVTIRNVQKDTITALPYAKEDVFGLVLYFNQALTVDDSQAVERTTRQLVDLAIELDGTFYLPYQLYYSPEQLRAAYPEIDAFFETKRRVDPDEILTNTWYETYRPKN